MTNSHRLEHPTAPIRTLTNDLHGVNLATVGEDGVTRIELTMERGEMGMVPWFAVYQGDHLAAMHNASHVSAVHYFEPEGDEIDG